MAAERVRRWQNGKVYGRARRTARAGGGEARPCGSSGEKTLAEAREIREVSAPCLGEGWKVCVQAFPEVTTTFTLGSDVRAPLLPFPFTLAFARARRRNNADPPPDRNADATATLIAFGINILMAQHDRRLATGIRDGVRLRYR